MQNCYVYPPVSMNDCAHNKLTHGNEIQSEVEVRLSKFAALFISAEIGVNLLLQCRSDCIQ